MSKQDNRINQMTAFIKSEAEEKAKEIDSQTKEDFAIEKQTRVEEEKKRLRAEYELKEKQVEVEKQINHSNSIKGARLEILKLKEDVMSNLKEKAIEAIKKLQGDEKRYREFLHDCIMQGLLTLEEKEVKLYCREADFKYLKDNVDKVAKQFSEKKGYQPKIIVQEKPFLDCSGGVLVSGLNDRIKVNNTIEERLELCFNAFVPEIRDILFPKQEALN